MSIGNIHANIRNQPTKRAWTTIAYIPIVKFLDHDRIRTTLNYRLFHTCMKIILQPLIEPGIHGTMLSDSDGNV